MKTIVEKLGIISPGYHREFGDNLTRRGQKFSDIKHYYSLDEMIVIDSAPEMLEALIESAILTEKEIHYIESLNHSVYKCHSRVSLIAKFEKNTSIIEKACYPKKWEEIKKLLNVDV